MRTENGIEVDHEALAELLRRADVLTIGFTLFPHRLLVDLRTNATDGQLATIVEPVASVQERYLWLGRHRGSFGAPEGFSFFAWPQTVRGLVERRILAPLQARLEGNARAQLESVLSDLLALEETAMRRAVTGAPEWPTLWDRSAAGRTLDGEP